ncbi:hypothetical protein E2562_032798 [Oryza meyeriana var. granulata]|uniref:Uncharacterized protein n=1 Tax=Oryza meyeriana var. granulata TaxID=110450 RepID=A0A6G1DQI3_9ORYZ|nr:hypothetical protein E2562_032798 [Oryza meyeriana var. granulata]
MGALLHQQLCPCGRGDEGRLASTSTGAGGGLGAGAEGGALKDAAHPSRGTPFSHCTVGARLRLRPPPKRTCCFGDGIFNADGEM